jgi:hypothetical protein
MPGAGAMASLKIQGFGEVPAVVRDISRGGIALQSDLTAPSSIDPQIGLPFGGSVSGRIVRCENGLVTLAFRQDNASMATVDRTLDAIKSRTRSVAA